MEDRVHRALVALARRLHEHGVGFQLGGSGLLAALGLTDAVGDLDIVVPADECDALERAAGPWWRGLVPADDHPLLRSDWWARLEVDGVPVDAIGGFGLRLGDGGRRVVTLPYRPSERSWVLDGVEVPLAPPELWWAIYRSYRPAKAELLAAVVPETARRRALAELGLNDAGPAPSTP